MTTKADLVDGFFIALFGTEAEQERILRRLRADEYRSEEKGRVAALVRQMKDDDAAESIRSAAERAAANGDPDSLKYLTISPTPELLAKDKFERVEAKLAHQHDIRTITYRRVITPRVVELYQAGIIDQEQLIACRWYRDVHEQTGLTGNVPSTDYSKEVFSSPQHRDFFTAYMIDAQDHFRAARSSITARWLPFFEAVVLEDVGLRRAMLRSRGDNSKSKAVFRDCAEELQACYDKLKKR